MSRIICLVFNQTRRDAIDGDAIFAKLQRKGTGQTRHSSLRGHDVRSACGADMSSNAADADNATDATLAQMRGGSLAAEKRSVQYSRNYLTPLLVWQGFKIMGWPNGGVVHQYVEAAKPAYGMGYHLRRIGRSANVTDKHHGLAPHVANFMRHALRRFAIRTGIDQNICTEAGEFERDTAPDSTRTTRDNCRPA